MKTIRYEVGMLVNHPNRPQWGPGKIVSVEHSKVHVFFRDALDRTAKPIHCSVVPLTVADSQTDAVLDELPAASQEGGLWLLPARFGQQAAEQPSPVKKKVKRSVPVVAPSAEVPEEPAA